MPVKKDPSGQRSVEAEVEVPGTPEEVWAAIATGPGMSSWFVPSTSEERVGGIATNNFGPGMESRATIKQWNPPHSFVAESNDGGREMLRRNGSWKLTPGEPAWCGSCIAGSQAATIAQAEREWAGWIAEKFPTA